MVVDANVDAATARLTAAALRINQRYLVEVVEAFHLCPFARQARLEGKVARRVLGQRDESPEPALAAIAELEADAALPDIGLLIFPRLAARLPPPAWDAFVERVRAGDAARHDGRPVFAAAAFHPGYAVDTGSAARLVPAIRRAPDPTLQLVRLTTLDAVREGRAHGTFLFDYSPAAFVELERRLARPSVSDQIAADNFARYSGPDGALIEAALADIQADRARAYAALGEV